MPPKSKKLSNFYNSNKWKKVRKYVYEDRSSKCEKCKIPLGKGEYQVHHIIHLSDENVDNYDISLNENNLQLLCLDCHNEIHSRFKRQKDRVFFNENGQVIFEKE